MQGGRQSRLLSRTYLEYICLFPLCVCVGVSVCVGGWGGGGGEEVTQNGLRSTLFYAWYLL